MKLQIVYLNMSVYTPPRRAAPRYAALISGAAARGDRPPATAAATPP